MAGDWLLGELNSGKSLGRQPRDWSLLNMLYFTLVIFLPLSLSDKKVFFVLYSALIISEILTMG